MENTGVKVINVQLSGELVDCIMQYISHQENKGLASMVCKEWYEKDSATRKHVTIAMSYSTMLRRPDQRFPNLQSLKLKGKPRASMYDFVPKDWGGSVTPWVQDMEDPFACLNSLHLHIMVLSDDDLEILADSSDYLLS
jgi:coronatine-insensitive protein 1